MTLNLSWYIQFSGGGCGDLSCSHSMVIELRFSILNFLCFPIIIPHEYHHIATLAYRIFEDMTD